MGSGTLPEYVSAEEIEALLAAAPHEPARLVMMVMWRAGLRVSEAVDLQIGDCRLKDRNPVLRVLRGKGRRSRLVPVHHELAQRSRPPSTSRRRGRARAAPRRRGSST